MNAEHATQQRVIDSVTISIEGDVPVAVESGGVANPALIRVYIGRPGYGAVTLWIDRDQVLRIATALLGALAPTPGEDAGTTSEPVGKGGVMPDAPAEPVEEMPFF